MKSITTFLLFLVFSSTYGQSECQDITAKSELLHDNLQFKILTEGEALNQLNFKTGIGPDGDLDTRTYSSIIYSSNIWAGGIDPNGNVKVSAGLYNHQDWTTGLVDNDWLIDAQTCLDWDRVFTVTKEEIIKARKVFLEGGHCSDIPASILSWPARDNPHLSFSTENSIVDFYDENFDYIYNPCDGDLPTIDVSFTHSYHEGFFSTLPSKISYYILNDVGKNNILSNATPTAHQIGVYVFSFNNQEVEDAIFIKYEIVNKDTDYIQDFRLGNWYDFDLGCPENDYLGTDTLNKMLYVYNSEPEDDCAMDASPIGGLQFGATYLQGMLDFFKIVDNNGEDSLITPQTSLDIDTMILTNMKSTILPLCIDEQNAIACNPEKEGYYHILNGLNIDETPILDPEGKDTKFMYSSAPTDPSGWSMCNDTSIPQTTAITSIGTGIAHPGSHNSAVLALFTGENKNEGCQSIAALQYKQAIIKDFYSNGFFYISGPPPPEVELSQDSDGITFSISNIPYDYSKRIPKADTFDNSSYKFEGIKIYQVKSHNFDLTELHNTDMSRVFYQGDIPNGVADISNIKTTFSGDTRITSEIQKVVGSDLGIQEELRFENDLFTNLPFETGQEYFFVAVSYAYNNYQQYDALTDTGQKYPYLESSCEVKVINTNIALSNEAIENPLSYTFEQFGQQWTLSSNDAPLQVRLISSSGQHIKQRELNHNSSLNSTEFSEIPSGIYIIQVINKLNRRMSAHKVIKI